MAKLTRRIGSWVRTAYSALALSLVGSICAVAQTVTPSPTATATATALPTPLFTATATPIPAQQTWTVDEIIAARKPPKRSKRVRYCQAGRFKPCVCAPDVSRDVQYRPSVFECGGNAAIVTSGRYLGIFSVVVRDKENRDRWPLLGINECTRVERDKLGLNKCSAFKVQKEIGVERPNGKDAEVHCLGASGYSPLFSGVVRMTGKLGDSPVFGKDPVARWCLKSPRLPLN